MNTEEIKELFEYEYGVTLGETEAEAVREFAESKDKQIEELKEKLKPKVTLQCYCDEQIICHYCAT